MQIARVECQEYSINCIEMITKRKIIATSDSRHITVWEEVSTLRPIGEDSRAFARIL